MEDVGGGVVQDQLQHLFKLLGILGHDENVAFLQLLEELCLDSFRELVGNWSKQQDNHREGNVERILGTFIKHTHPLCTGAQLTRYAHD